MGFKSGEFPGYSPLRQNFENYSQATLRQFGVCAGRKHHAPGHSS